MAVELGEHPQLPARIQIPREPLLSNYVRLKACLYGQPRKIHGKVFWVVDNGRTNADMATTERRAGDMTSNVWP
jgi:hypothetical protein